MSLTLRQFEQKWSHLRDIVNEIIQCLRLDSRIKLSGFTSWLSHFYRWTYCYTCLLRMFILLYTRWQYGMCLIEGLWYNKVIYIKLLEQSLKCLKNSLKLSYYCLNAHVSPAPWAVKDKVKGPCRALILEATGSVTSQGTPALQWSKSHS